MGMGRFVYKQICQSLRDYASETYIILYLVGMGRLELPRVAPYASETYVYTNSTTCPPGTGKKLNRAVPPHARVPDYNTSGTYS